MISAQLQIKYRERNQRIKSFYCFYIEYANWQPQLRHCIENDT